MKIALILFGITFFFLNSYLGYTIFNDVDRNAIWSGFSALATVDIALLTIFMVFFGGFQYIATKDQSEETKQNNKNTLAHAAYSEYLKLTLEYPDFAHPESSEIVNNYKVYNHYRWYIANMLFHFEEVLLAVGNDKDWEVTLKYQIKMHSWHICRNENYKQQGWDAQLEKLIETVTLQTREYRTKTNNFLTVANNCNVLYKQYLALILTNHHLLNPEKKHFAITANNIEYKIFLKSALCILGDVLEASQSNAEWRQTVQHELRHFEWYFKTVKEAESGVKFFTNKKHKVLICEHNYTINKHCGQAYL